MKKRLNKVLPDLGINQTQLGAQLGYPPSKICKVHKSNPEAWVEFDEFNKAISLTYTTIRKYKTYQVVMTKTLFRRDEHVTDRQILKRLMS